MKWEPAIKEVQSQKQINERERERERDGKPGCGREFNHKEGCFQQGKRHKHYITNKKRWSVNTRGFYCQLGNNLKHQRYNC